jgi:hypothetical protein
MRPAWVHGTRTAPDASAFFCLPGRDREKLFKNYALKSMEEVYAKLEEAALYIERNPYSVCCR